MVILELHVVGDRPFVWRSLRLEPRVVMLLKPETIAAIAGGTDDGRYRVRFPLHWQPTFPRS